MKKPLPFFPVFFFNLVQCGWSSIANHFCMHLFIDRSILYKSFVLLVDSGINDSMVGRTTTFNASFSYSLFLCVNSFDLWPIKNSKIDALSQNNRIILWIIKVILPVVFQCQWSCFFRLMYSVIWQWDFEILTKKKKNSPTFITEKWQRIHCQNHIPPTHFLKCYSNKWQNGDIFQNDDEIWNSI